MDRIFFKTRFRCVRVSLTQSFYFSIKWFQLIAPRFFYALLMSHGTNVKLIQFKKNNKVALALVSSCQGKFFIGFIWRDLMAHVVKADPSTCILLVSAYPSFTKDVIGFAYEFIYSCWIFGLQCTYLNASRVDSTTPYFEDWTDPANSRRVW